MLSRLALFVASLSAALVIAGGLALAGLAPSAASDETSPVAIPAETSGYQSEPPAILVDTVYLAPPGAAQDVTATADQSVAADPFPGGDDSGQDSDHDKHADSDHDKHDDGHHDKHDSEHD